MPVETEAPSYTSIRAPRGTTISCRGWQQEAAMRMLMNNLDEEVGERPKDLVVYGGTGRAARSWGGHRPLRDLEESGERRNLAGAVWQACRCFQNSRSCSPGAHREFESGRPLVEL